MATVAVLAALTAGGADGADGRAEEARYWDPVLDFAAPPRQANPNPDRYGNTGVWHFMGSRTLAMDPRLFELNREFTDNNGGFYPVYAWAFPANWMVNCTTQALTPPCCAMIWPPRALLTHPGATMLSVLGWRSPMTGRVAISGRVVDADNGGGDGVAWMIAGASGAILASGQITNGGAQEFSSGTNAMRLTNIAVTAGEFIYLAIDPKDTPTCDTTRVDINIREAR